MRELQLLILLTEKYLGLICVSVFLHLQTHKGTDRRELQLRILLTEK
jgi:hypothetical protein